MKNTVSINYVNESLQNFSYDNYTFKQRIVLNIQYYFRKQNVQLITTSQFKVPREIGISILPER